MKLVARTRRLPLREMRTRPELATMTLPRRGDRLSTTRVSDAEWRAVRALLMPL